MCNKFVNLKSSKKQYKNTEKHGIILQRFLDKCFSLMKIFILFFRLISLCKTAPKRFSPLGVIQGKNSSSENKKY